MTLDPLTVCRRYAAEPDPPDPVKMTGVAKTVRGLVWPLNGLRHPATETSTGWYLWGGNSLSAAPDFFEPVHTEHLYVWRPEVIPYLALPAGWRFLIGPDGYEDVWFDAGLLDAAT